MGRWRVMNLPVLAHLGVCECELQDSGLLIHLAERLGVWPSCGRGYIISFGKEQL